MECHGSLPALRGFIATIKLIYNIELYFARERDKLPTHLKKKIGKFGSCFEHPLQNNLVISYIWLIFAFNYYQYTRPNGKSASSKHTLSGPQKTDSGLLMHYQPYS